MNYHIITQDKFFDAYIEDIYKLQLEASNVFWVRGEKGEMSFLKTNRPIEYLGNDKADYVAKFKTLKPEDKLFVSWYDMFMGEAILESGINNKVYVVVMGGEFYAEPFWYHADWLFDKYTLKYLKERKEYGYPQVNWKRKPKNWNKIYKELCAKRHFPSLQKQLYEQKLKTISRIDYIVIPQEGINEFDLIKRLYPNTTFKIVNCCPFSQNFDAASLLPTKYFEKGWSINILIGNSADPTNNYLDAFRWLKKQCRHLSQSVNIYTVLSYGSELHKAEVIKYGKSMFGERFFPVVSYIDRDKYLSWVNSMDVIIMYHNRQQAVGNIMTAITLGKPVFMKACSPVYMMLKEQGCSSVYDVKEVSFENIEDIIQSANRDRANNVAIVKKIYSEETRLNNWRKLLE